jgi:predicted phage terminase large subunit-like protein
MANIKSPLVEVVAKQLAQRSLIDFALRVMPSFKAAPHARLIADTIQTALDTTQSRLLIVAPPQHGKSTLSSQLAPAFAIGQNPDAKIVLVSYAAKLAERNGRIVREIIRSTDWPFDVKLSPDSQALDHFQIDGHSGYIHSVGAGGSLTGFTADTIILDDLVASYEAASSEVERTKLVDWLYTVAMTRLSKTGKVIAIGTRWSEVDIISTLVAMGGFQILHLPALSINEFEDPLHRPAGAALWPAHKDETDLAKIKQEIGSLKFSTIYQGMPVPDAGVVWSRADLEHGYAKLPDNCALAFSIDPAGGVTASADPSVIAVLASDGVNFYIEHIERRNLAYYQLKLTLFEMYEKWLPARVWCESSSNGIALIDDVKQTSTLPIMPVKVSRSKVDRARAVAGLFESGKVKIRMDAEWYGDLVQEFLSFPNGRNDDIVDAVCMGLAILRESTAPGQVSMQFLSVSAMRAELNGKNRVPWNAMPGVNFFAKRGPRTSNGVRI